MSVEIVIREKDDKVLFHIDFADATEAEEETASKMCELFAAVNSIYGKPTIQLPVGE